MAGLVFMPMSTRKALSSASPALSMMDNSLDMTRMSAWVTFLLASSCDRRELWPPCRFLNWVACSATSEVPASRMFSRVRPWLRSCCMARAWLGALRRPSWMLASARAAFQT